MKAARCLVFGTLLTAAACSPKSDWRQPFIDAAEVKIRALAQDPDAKFSRTQLTGDDTTGQTCGYVTTSGGTTRRFIVYIDGSGGPFIDTPNNTGLEETFDFYWANDCVKEGYNAA